jgi:hypothetical protein
VTKLDVGAKGGDLCSLATDFDAYVDVEPRLESARWLDPLAPRAGSRAEVVGDIPFSVPAVSRFVGRPRGVATLERFSPPDGFAYRLETPRASGLLVAEFTATADGCHADVRGWILPKSRAGRIVLAPLAPLLHRLASDAVRRGVLRASAGVAGFSPRDG